MSSTEVRNLFTVLEDIATALGPLSDEVPGLQVTAFLNPNPSPPAIDIYPAAPFMIGTDGGFGVDSPQLYFTIRARVSTADGQAGQRLLLRLLDPTDAASVAELLSTIPEHVVPLEVSEYREYVDDGLLGCEWRVTTFL